MDQKRSSTDSQVQVQDQVQTQDRSDASAAPASAMVYDWDPHQETCYRLYIQERKSLEDIMEHMKLAHRFAPW